MPRKYAISGLQARSIGEKIPRTKQGILVGADAWVMDARQANRIERKHHIKLRVVNVIDRCYSKCYLVSRKGNGKYIREKPKAKHAVD